MKKTLAILLLVALFVGSALQAQDAAKPALRTWKDSTGQFSIQATFVRFNGDLVVLQGIDKKEISLPLTKLSVTDQKYVTITNTIGMKLNLIPEGTFLMGDTHKTAQLLNDDGTQPHKVTITKSYYIQTTEVTQGQWKAVMGYDPWKDNSTVKEGSTYAASCISWDDAMAYCKKLSEKEGKTYRLPTEAEWEYACRAGTQTLWSFGDDEKALSDYAWYRENSQNIGEKYAHKVGQKKPNGFGLYDMQGNVAESCYVFYKKPEDITDTDSRTYRGGTWHGSATNCLPGRRMTRNRETGHSGFGFRVVRELD